ncbi:unnamed protein product, partial [Natator depressus]
ATPTTPSVFPLVLCCSKTGNAPPDTSLACLVTGYLPSPVDIKWNSGQVTKGVKTFPEVTMSNGLHTQSSLLIPSDSSRQGDPYQCDVTHQGTAKTVSGKFPQESYGLTVPPQVYLLVPTCEDSATESQLELVCLLLSFRPGKADMKWLVNGKERSPPTPAFSSAMGTDGSYMGQSCMTITRQSSETGDIFTCQVTHPAAGTELSMQNASKCLACLRSSLDPTIYLTKPSYEDVIKTSGHVTCLVLGYDLAASRIAWKVDGQVSSAAKTEPPPKTTMGPPAWSVLTLCHWPNGDKAPYSGELTQDISMSNTGISEKEPSVTVSQAYHEDISGNRVSLTVICEASGFYPEEISMSWLKNNSPELKSSYNHGPVSGSGTFSAYSVLKVEPSQGEGNYTCVVHHPAMEEPKRLCKRCPSSVSNCNRRPLEVSLLLPSLEDLYIGQNATISCLGASAAGRWHLQCNQHPVSVRGGVAGGGGVHLHREAPRHPVGHCQEHLQVTAPSVYISPPHAEELALWELATITCLASGFQPRAILVTQTQQDRPVPQEAYTNIGPIWEAGKEERYFIYSKLNVLASEWERGDTYACVVGHEGLPMTFVQRSVDKASGKPSAVNVSVILSDTDVTCY